MERYDFLENLKSLRLFCQERGNKAFQTADYAADIRKLVILWEKALSAPDLDLDTPGRRALRLKIWSFILHKDITTSYDLSACQCAGLFRWFYDFEQGGFDPRKERFFSDLARLAQDGTLPETGADLSEPARHGAAAQLRDLLPPPF